MPSSPAVLECFETVVNCLLCYLQNVQSFVIITLVYYQATFSDMNLRFKKILCALYFNDFVAYCVFTFIILSSCYSPLVT